MRTCWKKMIRKAILCTGVISLGSCVATSPRPLRMPEGGLVEVERRPALKEGVLSARELAETGAASTIGRENKGNQGVVTAPQAQGTTTIIIQDGHSLPQIDPRGYQPTPYGIYPPGTVIYPPQRGYPGVPVAPVGPVAPVNRVPAPAW